MSRKSRLFQKCSEQIEDGQKPSVKSLSDAMSWAEEDVHRLLNALEKEKELETYSKQMLGKKRRFVSVYR
ncbi:MAG: hypothetical protein J07AB43_05170 [Candidatus Nanosalina sp. J07AB43]|nr:MAG: hypothetical protein J07AB43_05170 [Candidatus Nanosalina sp. J07AB43]